MSHLRLFILLLGLVLVAGCEAGLRGLDELSAPSASTAQLGRVVDAGGSCAGELDGTLPHVAAAGHHLAQRFGLDPDRIGGHRPSGSGDHPRRLALDLMVGDNRDLGQRISDYVIAKRGPLAVKYVIWRQTYYADSNGWAGRAMADRGSPTANHMDHVHISFLDRPGSGLPC